jgi:Fe-S cluster assembly iron-binding protein IscA
MLKLADGAARHLTKLLEEAQLTNGDAIRLEVGKGGWRLTVDHECPGDVTFDYEGRRVLVLSAASAKTLEDATLDFCETETGRSLQLTAPARPRSAHGDA